MKLKPAYTLAIVISLLIAIWFFYGSVIRPKAATGSQSNHTSSASNKAPQRPSVKVRDSMAEPHELSYQLHGISESNRMVSLKAETAGMIVNTPITEGRFVTKGTVICQQDIDARQAMVDQANAALQSRQLELDATNTLVAKGFRSSTQAMSAKAALNQSTARLKQAQIELSNVIIRAPFNGIIENYIAEIGDFLAPGQPCALLVDMDPLIINVQAGEKQIRAIKIGSKADITLATGESLTGAVRFIKSHANPSTHTFGIEIAVPNPKRTLKAGVSANVKIKVGEIKAHLIPSYVQTLSDQGVVGVRVVNDDAIVEFHPTTTIEETKDGIWVQGLPEQTQLIILGQDYVNQGSKVDTQYTVSRPTGGQ